MASLGRDNMRLALFLLIGCLVTLGARVTAAESQPPAPEGFALRLSGGLCVGPEIDSSAGTYRREVDRGRWVSATVVIGPKQLAELYALAVEARPEEYPEEFTPDASGRVIHARRYVINWQRGEERRQIRWADHRSMTPEALRLRVFLRQLRQCFEAFPEVASLPKAEVGCL